MTDTASKSESVRKTVMDKYAELAEEEGKSCCSASPSCCSKKYSDERKEASFAKKLGYSAEDLENLPDGANMGLSCGNPTAVASLKEGETVLDLGSGGGFDVFVAAQKVGPTGQSIGVDMTAAMIRKARQNAIKFEKRTGLANTSFRLGEIEHLPVADNSVDVVISNCVINLSPEKEQVWKEVARVLKPGGRACVSDVALLKPLPESLRDSIAALVGCVAGAVLIEDTVRMVEASGLKVETADKESAFISELETSEDPLYKNVMRDAPEGTSPRDFVASLRLVATKPSL